LATCAPWEATGFFSRFLDSPDHPHGLLAADNLEGEKELPMRQSGTVKFFNHSRGFGFITPDDGGKDVFLHISALQRSGLPALDEGARVSFETEPDRRGKGPQAINVQLGE
jgi:CspA family cold shock protein